MLHFGCFLKELPFWYTRKIPNNLWSFLYPYLSHFHQDSKFHSTAFESIIQFLFLDLFWGCEATIFYIASKILKLIQDLRFHIWCEYAKIHIISSIQFLPKIPSSFCPDFPLCKGSSWFLDSLGLIFCMVIHGDNLALDIKNKPNPCFQFSLVIYSRFCSYWSTVKEVQFIIMQMVWNFYSDLIWLNLWSPPSLSHFHLANPSKPSSFHFCPV